MEHWNWTAFLFGCLGAFVIQLFRIGNLKKSERDFNVQFSSCWSYVATMTLFGGVLAAFFPFVVFGSKEVGALIIGVNYDRVLVLLSRQGGNGRLERALTGRLSEAEPKDQNSEELAGFRVDMKSRFKIGLVDYLSIA